MNTLRNITIYSLLTICLLLATGCATPTPYRPADGGYGYTDTELGTNRYRVAFSGNYATPTSQAVDYAFLRVVELARQESKDFFVLLDANIANDTLHVQRPDSVGNVTGNNLFQRVEFLEPGSTTHSKPEVSLVVLFLNETTEGESVYSVAEVKALLDKKYLIERRQRTITLTE